MPMYCSCKLGLAMKALIASIAFCLSDSGRAVKRSSCVLNWLELLDISFDMSSFCFISSPQIPVVETLRHSFVVVDDVISSGKTMQKLHENNSWRFPRAEWIGAAWFSQIFRTRPLSGVKGYSSVFASILTEGVNGKKVPINSLSTLREDTTIAQSYAKRHYVDADKFLRLIRA